MSDAMSFQSAKERLGEIEQLLAADDMTFDQMVELADEARKVAMAAIDSAEADLDDFLGVDDDSPVTSDEEEGASTASDAQVEIAVGAPEVATHAEQPSSEAEASEGGSLGESESETETEDYF